MAWADIHIAERAASGGHTPCPTGYETDMKNSKRKERSPAKDENADKRNRIGPPITFQYVNDRNDKMNDHDDHEVQESVTNNENSAQSSGVE